MDYEVEVRAAGESPSLAGYLERVTLAAGVDEIGDTPKLVLMTVHSAKGLEFKAVFLTGLEDEVFPYKGLAPGEEEELEEERRLAYVALTRAREHLFLSHAQTRTLFGQQRYGRPSRFLLHLPQNDIETVTSGSLLSRFIDRPNTPALERQTPWRHPLAMPSPPPPPPVRPGGRYVDREAFDDVAPRGTQDLSDLRRGSRVRHARFGEGEVRRVEQAAETIVVAFFPGWGEKKILAKFLQVT
jgi:DNA helicase-2/ATP-dependent DNA helicase PcrA